MVVVQALWWRAVEWVHQRKLPLCTLVTPQLSLLRTTHRHLNVLMPFRSALLLSIILRLSPRTLKKTSQIKRPTYRNWWTIRLMRNPSSRILSQALRTKANRHQTCLSWRKFSGGACKARGCAKNPAPSTVTGIKALIIVWLNTFNSSQIIKTSPLRNSIRWRRTMQSLAARKILAVLVCIQW